VTDRIAIRGLRVQAHVGVTPEERAREQTLVIDVEISTDLSRSSYSDELEDTIDYSAAVSRVADAVRSTSSSLLEHLAAEVASVVSRMDGVRGVTVEISKDPPPVSESVEAISVTIERAGA
jgi:7,8-dihydroneopterin aldolase/epimerase/oxygenase